MLTKKITHKNNWAILCSLVLFFIVTFPLSSNSAQLIQTIPAKLIQNWEFCAHYATKNTSCIKTSFPLKDNPFNHSVKFQSFSKDFILNSDLKNSTIGIQIFNLDEVDEVYINDQLIGKTGNFLPDFKSGLGQQRLYLIPNNILRSNQFNQIYIKTFSSQNLPGIKTQPPIFVNYIKAHTQIKNDNYYLVIATTLLLLMAMFQIYYFVFIKKNYASMFFFIFLIAIAFIAIARAQLPINLNIIQSSNLKLEMLVLNIGVAALILIFFNFFDLDIKQKHYIGLLILAISSLAIIISPISVHLRKIAEINYWLIIIVCFLVVGSAILTAVKKQRDYAALISVAYFIEWMFLLYDASLHSVIAFKFDLALNYQILPIATAIVVIVFSLILTHKYWYFFKGSAYDHLTGTLLKPIFYQRLSEEMHRNKKNDTLLLVAVIDLKNVIKINISDKTKFRDSLLLTVASSLRKSLQPFDLICRVSDEHFFITSSLDNKQEAEECLKRIYDDLIKNKQTIKQSSKIFLDVVIGGIIYDKNQHLTVSHLISDTNYALSKTKTQSRHNYLVITKPTAAV